MSFLPGAFYVFLQDDSALHLAIFPTRAHADKFWRIVQRIRSGGPCRRFHSQYYIVPVLPNRVQNNPDWNENMCLVRQLKNDCLPVIPPDLYPDHKNGASFYIRSTLHPKFHWYFNSNNRQVELSKTNQTKFTFTRINTPSRFQTSPTRSEEDILIGEDAISLSVGLNGQRVYIVKGPENTLIPSNELAPFQFGRFERGFYGFYGKTEGLVCSANNGDDVGERWEFVA